MQTISILKGQHFRGIATLGFSSEKKTFDRQMKDRRFSSKKTANDLLRWVKTTIEPLSSGIGKKEKSSRLNGIFFALIDSDSIQATCF
jgi:hypothetical protein